MIPLQSGVEGGLQLQTGQQPFEHILQNLLAPINSNSFQEVIGQVKQNLIFLNQVEIPPLLDLIHSLGSELYFCVM